MYFVVKRDDHHAVESAELFGKRRGGVLNGAQPILSAVGGIENQHGVKWLFDGGEQRDLLPLAVFINGKIRFCKISNKFAGAVGDNGRHLHEGRVEPHRRLIVILLLRLLRRCASRDGGQQENQRENGETMI